nr:PREDICTED: ribonuclease H1 [Tribolium castaneum]|eukprot:XP_001810667.2 PREDICTED: ribonuclease H1 [Tribolium castaneum]
MYVGVGANFLYRSWIVLKLSTIRLTSTLISCNLTEKLFPAIVGNSLAKFAPTASIMAADPSKLKELNLLFERLQEAKAQADLLKNEMIDIKKELVKAESLFPKSFQLNCKNTDQCDSKNINSPPAKKTRYDFSRHGDYVTVYTDGACENNGREGAKAGIGVWFGDNHPLNVSKPVKGKATNNAAEIQACICAVQIARDNGIKKLQIITDSQFTINAMTKWIKSWKKNNWKLSSSKNPVKNKTDFQELDKLCEGLDVQWQHVAGHSGIKGNECADMLAREGAKLYVE